MCQVGMQKSQLIGSGHNFKIAKGVSFLIKVRGLVL